MSFSLYDANGYVGDAPSAVALEQLHRYATPDSALAELLDNGFTERLDELTEQLMLSSTPVVDPIIEALKNAEDVLILTDDVPADEITTAIGNGNNQYKQDNPTKSDTDRHEVIRRFTQSGGTYREVNGHLRENREASPEAKQTIEILDQLFEKEAEPIDRVLYRGLSGYDPEELGLLEIGAEFHDPGFVSTTSDQRIARRFAAHSQDGKLSGEGVGTIFKINAKGMPGVNMSRYSRYGEDETLLPRGSTFKVTSVKEGIPGESLSVVTMSVVKK
jgi:hypothetical protein